MGDRHWFDEVHQTLSQEAPRRGLLRAAGALLAGLIFEGAPRVGEAKRKRGKGRGRGRNKEKRKEKGEKKAKNTAENCGADHCASDQTCCPDASGLPGSSCVNTEIDPDNCGLCARVCRPDQECFHGGCFCKNEYARDCDGRCIDVSADNANCGGCNVVCSPDRHCVEGNCLPGEPAACPDGFAQCHGSTCINIKTHDSHCGRCFHPCFGDTRNKHCVDGVCVPLTPGDVKPCTTSGGGAVFVPKDWPCCANDYGYCHEGARCTFFNECVVD